MSEAAAQRSMSLMRSTPMRQDHDGPPALPGGKPLRMNGVVFAVRRFHRGRKPQQALRQLEIARRFIAEKSVAVFERQTVEHAYVLLRTVPVARNPARARPTARPFQ